MIDRKARTRAAELVEKFWSGVITNRELERSWLDSHDSGVLAVEDIVWTLYDDFKVHTAHEEDRSDHKLSGIVSNCVAFLRSDEEYTWPHFGTCQGAGTYAPWAVSMSLGLLNLWNRVARAREEQYWTEMRAHGDVNAWPFTRKRPSQ